MKFLGTYGCIVLLLGLAGCSSVDTGAIDNLHDGEVQVIGHAGLGFVSLINPINPYPANSRTSILKALEEYGADGVEVDVQMTRDSVMVLYHDRELDSRTERTGCIIERSADEVVGAAYHCGFPYDLFHSETVIALEELLLLLKEQEPFPALHLDLHAMNQCDPDQATSHYTAFSLQLVLLLKRHQIPADRVVLISTQDEMLQRFRVLDPSLPLMLELLQTPEERLDLAIERKYSGVVVKGKLLTADLAQRAHAAGLEVVAFGGKSRSGIADILRQNPDAVQVNNVEAMRDLLD
ncbi:MAG: glycerophosphodiester phosphodiesterase [Bacteroidota bacterium]